ncbi:hypothetical protein ACIPW5_06300 [Streptomyces sp. NPDC090077]|uniref:hypothetical protein n=1 Tax=Streptomyces sp. NPDC090077 TaxID=3365938 RepID=UPI00380F8560
MTPEFLQALDAVVWDGLETGYPEEHPVRDVPRALRRLARAGAHAVADDHHALYSLVTRDGCETPSAAAVALPFVIALAADPATGARVDLVDLLACMYAPALADADWSGAWALLADPDPAVRRAATTLPVGTTRLLGRWEAESDPSVRLPLLLALGQAASGDAADDDARAVLAGVLDGDDPVMWVAAVHAAAERDRELPVRQLDRLIEVFSDTALRPRFEEVWYTPDIEVPWTREDLVRSTARLLGHDPGARLSFAVRLAGTAQRSGDAALCREALDVAWELLTERRSVEAALLPLAGGLLTDPDGAVRLRAANILAVLGPRAAPYADRLAGLLDDDAADPYLDGTVREIARWALTRIGDPRALPGLVAQLRAQQEEQGRGYVMGDPRRPEAEDVLIPLRAHADVLLPEMREAMRSGPVRGFLTVLEAWGEAARPALPELLPLLADTRTSVTVLRMLPAMGPAAASAVPAVRAAAVLDHPGNHRLVARTAACLGADRRTALRIVGEEFMAAEEPQFGPFGALAEFGRDAAPYADRVRLVMESTSHWPRLSAAITLWEITGRTGPSMRVLEEFVLPVADGDDGYGFFRDALRTLIRMGELSPAVREALLAVRRSQRRLSAEGGYPMVLRDEELRGLIEEALACDGAGSGPTGDRGAHREAVSLSRSGRSCR